MKTLSNNVRYIFTRQSGRKQSKPTTRREQEEEEEDFA